MNTRHLIFLATLLISTPSQAGIWDGMGIPANNYGHSSIRADMNQMARDIMRDADIPGLTLAVTKRGRLVYSGGLGVSNWNTREEMQPNYRAAIGSTSKVIVTIGMMHMLENQRSYGLDSKVYGSGGILNDPDFPAAFTAGLKRHYPIIGMAINRVNRVIAWYSDGKYTVGASTDLETYHGPRNYSLPPGKSPTDVVDMAFGGSNGVVITYFRDKTYAVGKPHDLDYFFYSTNKYTADQGPEKILGITADTTRNLFYAFYDNGTVSSGNSLSQLANRWVKSFTTYGNQKKRYKIIALARSDNGHTLAWFSNGKFSRGNVRNLASITENADFTRRSVPNSILQWKKAYRNITIRHLLSHTSGLIRSGNRGLTRLKYADELTQYNHDFLIPYKYSNMYVLSTQHLLFKPGEGYSYSNHGMGLAGYLIKKVSGLDWYLYLRENILNPYGLGAITPVGQYHNSAIDSRFHSVDGNDVTLLNTPNWPSSGSAAGSLRSSAQDLVALLVRTDRLGNYPDVLSSSSIETMESRPFPTVAPGQALGWQIACKASTHDPCYWKRLSHNGKSKYGTSYMAKYQGHQVKKRGVNATVDDINVAVVSNSSTTDVAQLKKIMDLAAWLAQLGNIPSSYDLFQANPN